MAKYKVEMSRLTTSTVTLTIEAKSKAEAQEIAELEVIGAECDPETENTDHEVVDITRI